MLRTTHELLERQKVETLKLGMVCAVVYENTLMKNGMLRSKMMTPGQIRLHSTCSAFLERYWLHGRNVIKTLGTIVLYTRFVRETSWD
jgi:hypothetical protein